jgi:asparagine synthase (glutamine-hydrolysing)
MCGIVGIVGEIDRPLEETVCAMRDVFPYRGPDAKGLWVCESSRVALGHRRLSILDVSEAGTQPMHSATGDQHVVFNGEVYNYLELRKELLEKGHCFRTNTDTEVLLAAYREWGAECLQRFNGMWGFAIWDEAKQRLFLARDRLGVKPVYYLHTGNAFYFASEVKAILAVASEPSEVATELIDSYMSFGYIPGEDTLVRGIKRLMPGHYLELQNNRVTVRRYWDLHFSEGEDRGLPYYLDQTRRILENAIDLRLRSDVPLGILLSGGLDSSAVVGLLAPRVGRQLKTFSVAYDFGPQYDETQYARLVARRFNTDHHEIVVRPEEFRDFIPRYVWLMDEPVTEAAAISLFFVSQLAKDHVTVVLSGEGADEVFAGYDWYRYMQVLERYRGLVGAGGARLASRIARACLPPTSKLLKYLTLANDPLEKRHRGVSTHEEHYKQTLYRRDFADHVARRNGTGAVAEFIEGLFRGTNGADALGKMLRFDTKTWLPDDLLIKADRMSMANSLELRVPFLDYRLVEFVAAMPSRYKLNGRSHKFLLKEMMRGILPGEILDRKKMGFPTPLAFMFQGGLREFCRDTLLAPSARIREYFEPQAVATLLAEHAAGRCDHHRAIWQLLVLEHWLQGWARQTLTARTPLAIS